MKRIATAAGLFVVLMLLAVTAVAKGGVEQVTVTGPGLEHHIELSDPQVLDRFNPWGGLHQFLGQRPDSALQSSLAVHFGLERVPAARSRLFRVFDTVLLFGVLLPGTARLNRS